MAPSCELLCLHVVQLLNGVWLCDSVNCSTPGFSVITITQSLLKLIFIESVMPSNHLIHYHLLLLLPSIFPSIRVFSSESGLCIMWPKDWILSSSISHSNEYSGLISSRIDWFALLAVQRNLRSLLQHHNLKASVLPHSAFLWSNSHMHTWLLEKP